MSAKYKSLALFIVLVGIVASIIEMRATAVQAGPPTTSVVTLPSMQTASSTANGLLVSSIVGLHGTFQDSDPSQTIRSVLSGCMSVLTSNASYAHEIVSGYTAYKNGNPVTVIRIEVLDYLGNSKWVHESIIDN